MNELVKNLSRRDQPAGPLIPDYIEVGGNLRRISYREGVRGLGSATDGYRRWVAEADVGSERWAGWGYTRYLAYASLRKQLKERGQGVALGLEPRTLGIFLRAAFRKPETVDLGDGVYRHEWTFERPNLIALPASGGSRRHQRIRREVERWFEDMAEASW